jgi:hypothetical protein
VLTKLDLSTCSIGGTRGEPGIQALAKALAVNGTITDLSLVANNIDSEGAGVLAPAIASNRVMRILDLSDNRIGGPLSCDDSADAESGVGIFAAALQANRTITELSLAKNKLDSACTRTIARAVLGSALCSLNISGNSTGAAMLVGDPAGSVPNYVEYLGLYERQRRPYNGKPVYSHVGSFQQREAFKYKPLSCYFVQGDDSDDDDNEDDDAGGFWMFGQDVGKDQGCFIVRQDSATPSAATQPVQYRSNGGWKISTEVTIRSSEGSCGGNIVLSAVPAAPGFAALCIALEAQNGVTPPGSGVVQMGPINEIIRLQGAAGSVA